MMLPAAHIWPAEQWMQSQMCFAGKVESVLDSLVPAGQAIGIGVPSGQYEPSGQNPFGTD